MQRGIRVCRQHDHAIIRGIGLPALYTANVSKYGDSMGWDASRLHCGCDGSNSGGLPHLRALAAQQKQAVSDNR